MDPFPLTGVEIWYGPLMWAFGTAAACVAGVLVILLRPRRRNRRRHRLGQRLVASGQLRRVE